MNVSRKGIAGMSRTRTGRSRMTRTELNAIAWRFLRSEFTRRTYADWALDRRLDAFLQHHGPTGLLRDGSTYDDLLDRVMANVGPALRSGVLPP
ncbi:hypothetical protein MAGR_17670 [Mycolicibacterium agri]|uniref:Uncharacterized protein n=3 Tax=Mycolicibacterium agri TaxID=36811 RepID=A0A7I9VZ95_MYCAG|nr:hypothetical protein MAGR_17670 [Mycolicibacterium agri]